MQGPGLFSRPSDDGGFRTVGSARRPVVVQSLGKAADGSLLELLELGRAEPPVIRSVSMFSLIHERWNNDSVV